VTVPEMASQAKTPEDIHLRFRELFADWERDVKDVIKVNVISDTHFDEFKEDSRQLRDWSRLLARSAKHKYEEMYPDVVDSMKTVKNNIITLESLLNDKEKSEQNTDNRHQLQEADADLKKEINSLSVSFDLANQNLVLSVEKKLNADTQKLLSSHITKKIEIENTIGV